jgi:mono/diheme cytochrome c family protein
VVRLAALAAAILVLAGCGATSSRSGRYGPAPTSAEATFIRMCSGCHTLAKLRGASPTSDDVLAAIRNGPGPMPADLVGGDEAQLVANYVAR